MTRGRSGPRLGDVALEEWAVAFDSLPHEATPSVLPPEVAEELDGQGGLMTLREAAKAVGVSMSAVRHWVKREQVFTFEWDGQLYVGEQSLYDCELARRVAPGWDDDARARREVGADGE